MSSLTFKPSRSPATILAAPRKRWTQAQIDEEALAVCNAWFYPPELTISRRTDPQSSRLFGLVANALGKVNGD